MPYIEADQIRIEGPTGGDWQRRYASVTATDASAVIRHKMKTGKN
jgi:hypothetical protein